MNEANVAAMNGFLQAFEVLNTGADHGPTFTLDRIGEATGDLDLTVAKHFSQTNYQLRLVTAGNWKQELSHEMDRWLFDLLKAPDSFAKEMVGERFLELLGKALGGEVTGGDKGTRSN